MGDKFMTTAEIIGQILGGVAVLLGFLTYQMRSAGKVLLMQTALCLVFVAHYGLLNALPAMVLNIVAAIRNITYFQMGKKPRPLWIERGITALFVVIMLALGAWSWQDWRSALVIIGITINTVAMNFKDPQNIRKSILVSSPIVLLYDILVVSIGGAVFESVATISSIIGIVRHKKK